MALNKLMLSALKLLSYNDIDVTRNYKLDRRVRDILSAPVIPPYNIWDHEIDAGGHKIPVRVFIPDEQKSSELLLFFHGGGWVVGDINTYTKVCSTLSSSTGRRVLSVDYRLAPEYKFPSAPEDCYTAARELYRMAPSLGADPDDTVLIGDSAGGNLAAVVSLMASERGEFPVNRQILLYPSTGSDHTPSSRFKSIVENGSDYLLTSKQVCDYISLYLRDEKDYADPHYAPLLAKSLSGQPRTLVLTARYDPLRDEGEEYAARLKAEGCDVECHRIEDAIHGFFSLPKSFESVRKSYMYINTFLARKN